VVKEAKLRLRWTQWLSMAVLAGCVLHATGVSQGQLTDNEKKASVGDSPADPGSLADGLSPALSHPAIHAAMRKVADWQNARIAATPSRDWTFSTLYVGLLAASRTLDDSKYHDTVLAASEHFDWTLGPRRAHADDQALGQAYLALYREKPDPVRIAGIRAQFDALMLTPDDPRKPVWWWCDALFMAPPVWAGLADASGDSKYLGYMDHEWHITSDLLWDSKEKLFSRDSAYLTRYEKNGRKMFWSRGNGWVMGGLVQVLERMPADDPRRPFYVKKLQDMAEAVAASQDQDGLWRAGLLDSASYPNPEISGSAFFVYAMTWGVRHGLLDEQRYMPVVRRGWAGMLRHIYADGRLGDVQPVGEAPGAYTAGASYVFGVGSFLLAGSELDAFVSSPSLSTKQRHPHAGHP
jgi:rhamnogalacturonyl hydrolase YesR